jgi:hypothetical protein
MHAAIPKMTIKTKKIIQIETHEERPEEEDEAEVPHLLHLQLKK